MNSQLTNFALGHPQSDKIMPPSQKHSGGEDIRVPVHVAVNIDKNGYEVNSENDSLPRKVWMAGVGAAVFYGICSTSMAFINKAVVSSYKFNFPFFIMACQMLVIIIFLEFLRISRKSLKLPPYSFTQGWMFLWPTMFYALHSVTALSALGGMSIPMYAAIKRCSPIVTLFLSVFILHKPIPSLKIILSIIFITAGCVIAGIGDLSFDALAYAYGTVSVVAQGLYLTLIQQGAENKMSTIHILQLNSFNTFPLFVMACLFSNEAHDVVQYLDVNTLDANFISCLVAQIIIGSVLNYSLFLCTALNSALTTSLIGVFKSVFQTTIGFFTFGGVIFHPLNITGLVLNTYGAVLYTFTRFQEKKVKTTKTTIEKPEKPTSKQTLFSSFLRPRELKSKNLHV